MADSLNPIRILAISSNVFYDGIIVNGGYGIWENLSSFEMFITMNIDLWELESECHK